MLLGVLSSLVASFVYAALWLLLNALIQRSRAKRFVGVYRMFGADGSEPTGGTVRIERKNWREDLLSSSPALAVSAEHGAGRAPGTEEWNAIVEMRGFSNTASGYYSYRNRSGGSLRFELFDGGKEITEYGTPFEPGSRPFILTLKRVRQDERVTLQ
jgi:hypothetical protein